MTACSKPSSEIEADVFFSNFRLLLAKNKSLVDVADPEGRTALHWATKPESHKVLEFLSQYCGSEIGEKRMWKSPSAVQLINASFVVVNCQDDEQNTALHWSVLCHHPEHTRVLLQVFTLF